MKMLLLTFFEIGTENQFLSLIKKAMDKYSAQAILYDIRADAHIGDSENGLYESLMNQQYGEALREIRGLKKAYETFGKKPTKVESGYFEMIAFLNQLEETIMVISAQ